MTKMILGRQFDFVHVALLLALPPGCALAFGIDDKPCQPGCVTETSRLVCDEDGRPREEACPAAEQECFRAACETGACVAVPDVGKACGEDAAGTCNPAGACSGPTMMVSALLDHSCARLYDGSVWCWGDNTWGQLGDGTREFRSSPVRVKNLEPARWVGTGYAHSCAVTEQGRIFCWGDNEGGQCGTVLSAEPILRPSLVEGLDGIEFERVTGGKAHTCARSTAGSVYCWGYNDFGQAGVDPEPDGRGDPTVRSVLPSTTPVVAQAGSVEANKNHSCAVTGSGLLCWGNNDFGQIAQDPATVPYSFEPVPVALPSGAIDVGIGFESSYAVGENNRVYAWGNNARGQLGIGATVPDRAFTPMEVMFDGQLGLDPLLNATEVFRSDGSHQCAKVQNAVEYGAGYVCWGGNDHGELGYGTLPTKGEVFPAARPATKIPAAGISMAHGEDHGCVVVLRGAGVAEAYDDVWCWGRKELIGDGTALPANPAETLPPQLDAKPVLWLPE